MAILALVSKPDDEGMSLHKLVGELRVKVAKLEERTKADDNRDLDVELLERVVKLEARSDADDREDEERVTWVIVGASLLASVFGVVGGALARIYRRSGPPTPAS